MPSLFVLRSAAAIMTLMTEMTTDETQEKKSYQWVHILILLAAGIILGVWLSKTPPGVYGKARAVGYAVCHQIEERSFHFHGTVSPMCARCTGMYMGVLVAGAYYALRGKQGAALFPSWKINALLIGFVVLWGLDGFNSYLHLIPGAPRVFPPSNTNRMITGSLMGINLMTLLAVGFNQVVWKSPKEERILAGFKELGLLLVLVLAMDGLVLLEVPAVIAAVSWLSVVSVILLLTGVYAMAVLLVTNNENRYEGWWSLRWLLLAGFVLALVQTGALDLGRYLLTGTWEGGLGL